MVIPIFVGRTRHRMVNKFEHFADCSFHIEFFCENNKLGNLPIKSKHMFLKIDNGLR